MCSRLLYSHTRGENRIGSTNFQLPTLKVVSVCQAMLSVQARAFSQGMGIHAIEV
jgi:hypothetical protein